MTYTIQKSVTGDFDDVVETTIAALDDDGFGVLCDIDMQATLDEKLGEEFQQYRILGACNPPLAHEGLTEDVELGALLPCNVIVYEADDGDVVVSAVDPRRLVGLTDNDALASIGTEVADRFERVLEALSQEHETAESTSGD
ncbi:DUF302 domain-containing protein [Halovivax cerinus]|uniref:DUF302 domain-containing protein n=1 Tax=Halovivax cerinus TaxID=1487865 RepID=A0ABD5NR41_9EURY|nr:DUF302 domain-containing protein [Halovivax cerinus]